MSNQSQSQQQASQPEGQAQSNTAGQEVLAVACVIDASLALAAEWTRVFTAYILPILKRLNEAYSGHNFRLGIVTYGTADHPLVSKRFFFLPNVVMKELREEPGNLGIGTVNGVRGLSALEGMVAAIESFDMLHNSLPGPKDGRIHVSHIIHIAGSPPDSAQRPTCNAFPHLDSVSWDTLPVELKKRKINLSLVTLQQIQQFQDVQSATSAPTPQTIPWFTVYAPHTLMLSGFPPLSHVQTPKLNAAKRPNESPQTPDTKRQKVGEKSSPALGPRAPGGPIGQRPPSRQVPTPSVLPSTLPPQPQPHPQLLQPSPKPPHGTTTRTPSPAKPPAAPAAHPPSNVPNPNAPPMQFTPNINMLVERGKALEAEIKALDAKIQEAQSAGNAADVEPLKMERATKFQQAIKIKTILYQMVNRPTMGGSNSGAGGSGEVPQSQFQHQLVASNTKLEDAAPPTVSAPVSVPMDDQKPPVTDQKPPLTDQQALMHFMQTRPGFSSPEVAVQMQKLLSKTGLQGATLSDSPKLRPAHPSASGSTSQHQSQPHHQSQHQASASAMSGGQKQWEGSFAFTVQHAGQSKGFEVQVVAVNSKGQLHTEKWPERMFINISQTGMKDPVELKLWLQKHRQSVVMVQFKPQARTFEQKMNDMIYHVLMKTMVDARTFGVVAWQLPSGPMSHNMIVFPMNNVLVGAVFPLTGLPDLPGSSKVDASNPQPQMQPQSQSQLQLQPQPQLQHPGVLAPEMLTQLQGLNPQQQRNFMQQLTLQQQMRMRQRQQLQQHQQQQLQTGAMQQEVQAPAPGVGMQNMSPFSNGANLPMNMFGGGGVPQRPINGGMHVGGVGTVNSEMMQSFMQRSANGQGMNPS